MASPFVLTGYTKKKFVVFADRIYDPSVFEKAATRFEHLRTMFAAIPDPEMAARFEGLRDSEQSQANWVAAERQACLRLFLADQGESVPDGATVTIQKDELGDPNALSW